MVVGPQSKAKTKAGGGEPVSGSRDRRNKSIVIVIITLSRETSVRRTTISILSRVKSERVYIYEREVGRLLGSEWNLSALLLPPIVATSLLLLGVFAALLRLLSFSSSTTTSAVPDINCVCSYCLLRPADEGKYVKRIRSVPKTKKGRQRRTGTALAEKEKLKRLAGNLQCGGNENRLQGTEGMKDVGPPRGQYADGSLSVGNLMQVGKEVTFPEEDSCVRVFGV